MSDATVLDDAEKVVRTGDPNSLCAIIALVRTVKVLKVQVADLKARVQALETR